MRSAMHAGNGWLVRHLALAVLACSMLPSYAQEAGSPQATDSTPESASDAPRAGVAAGDAVAVERVDPAMLPAEPAPLATRSLLLDIAEASQRAIAVGERGHVLLSESRHDWRQVEGVPTRATLTAVTTVGDHAWAVGHAQVILHSADGGLSWERQHVDAYDAEDFDDLANGAPLLDVLFLDQQHGLAIGAYGLLLRTADGGVHWERGSVSEATARVEDAAPAGAVEEEMQSVAQAAGADGEEDGDDGDDSWTFSDDDLLLEELSDPHLNAIARTGSGALFIVAERGSAFRSRDQGASWERIAIPYEGSMFGVIGYEGDRVLVFGLRGNVFESRDLGDSWNALDSGTEQSLQGGAALANGGAVLVGSNGVVLVRSGADAQLEPFDQADGGVLAGVLPAGGARELVVVGERGVSRFSGN